MSLPILTLRLVLIAVISCLVLETARLSMTERMDTVAEKASELSF